MIGSLNSLSKRQSGWHSQTLVWFIIYCSFFPVALLLCCHAFVLKCTSCGSFVAGVAPPSPKLLMQIYKKTRVELTARWRLRLQTKRLGSSPQQWKVSTTGKLHIHGFNCLVLYSIETYANPYAATYLFVFYLLSQKPKTTVKTLQTNRRPMQNPHHYEPSGLSANKNDNIPHLSIKAELLHHLLRWPRLFHPCWTGEDAAKQQDENCCANFKKTSFYIVTFLSLYQKSTLFYVRREWK